MKWQVQSRLADGRQSAYIGTSGEPFCGDASVRDSTKTKQQGLVVSAFRHPARHLLCQQGMLSQPARRRRRDLDGHRPRLVAPQHHALQQQQQDKRPGKAGYTLPAGAEAGSPGRVCDCLPVGHKDSRSSMHGLADQVGSTSRLQHKGAVLNSTSDSHA